MTTLKELEESVKKTLNMNDINSNNNQSEETQIMNFSGNVNNVENCVNISMKDYTLILKLIITLSQRGAFSLDEYSVVGDLYNNLKNIKL